jgi:hypothetical protein
MKKHISTKEEAIQKVLSKLVKVNDCLVYTGYRNRDGYGVIKIGGRKGKFIRVHRLLYEDKNGSIPPGFFICHKCDNPPCCNINHLFLGTHNDNMRDMVKKDRAYRTIGEKSGVHKLTSIQINEIRKDSRFQKDIAKDYGIAKSTVSMIKNFKTRRDG